MKESNGNRGFHEEPVEYGVLIPSSQLTQQVAYIEMSPMPLNAYIMCFFCKITYKQYSSYRNSSDFNIITLILKCHTFNHGYIMA